VTFVRCAVGLLLVVPMVRNQLASILRPARLRLHLGRVTAGLLSMACGFYAFAHMPLAEATALTFTMPLFMLMLATVTLGERVGWRRASAALVGFSGVLVMLRPGAVPVEPAALLALLSAFFHAWSGIFIKKLSGSESTGMIMFYFAAVGSVLFALPAASVWVVPDPIEWLLLGVVAILGVVSQLAFIEAARAAEMSAIVPIDYSRVIFAGLIGYLVWSELPDAWAIACAALIGASTCFISFREMQLARAAHRGGADAAARDG
jgi:drug/metabolite transporter (DMT)-like permease